MKNHFDIYLSELARTRAATENTGTRDLEHQHRPALKKLLEVILPNVDAINEPGKIEFGAPDFALIKNNYPIGYIETKRIGENLDEIVKGEQLKRYFGYASLILTNYLEFRFYKHGEQYAEPIIISNTHTFESDKNAGILLETTIRAFLEDAAEPVRRAEILAKIMGESGKRLRANLLRFLKKENDKNNPILEIYGAFKSQLIHDLSLEDFADMYAQTLVYGLFVARYHDESQKDFSRQEARDLIPHTNPLLRRFFDHIAGADFDTRLKPIVDELCDVFSRADVKSLMEQLYRQDLWGSEKASPDPVIHFYEDFLKEYDSAQRKKLGAYYTPPAVVHFIVKSVDTILKKDFNLAEGLADTKKIPVTRELQGKKITEEIHQVQVLDPAVGTGTFLNELIRLIRKSFTGQEGRFGNYVSEDLLPRIHGFELMMAPYTIAHLKLAATLRESGAKDFKDRIGIYLTNSLEPAPSDDGRLPFTIGLQQSISEESRAAAKIKNHTPIMVVIGNPPYSVSSNNPSITLGEDGKKHKTWIGEKIDDYKKDLGEKKINLDDDYIKFIRLAEHFIEKNRTGIVAMITNNSYLDGITHRQMRKHLLETFDDIYVLDLHGNSKKKEKNQDGGKDENVFAIQQGVAISIFVRKRNNRKVLGSVYHYELRGKRAEKNNALDSLDFDKTNWKKIEHAEPNYFFVPKDFKAEEEYKKGFSVIQLFNEYNSGIQTKRDSLTIQFTESELKKAVEDTLQLSENDLRQKYNLPADGRDWRIEWAKNDLEKGYSIEKIFYRPFDLRWTAYTSNSKGFIAYPRNKTNRHIVAKDNLSLLTSRMIPPNQDFDRASVVKHISDIHSASDQTYVFPLYLYADDGSKIANLNKELVNKIKDIIGEMSPEDIIDYIYAILHSPSYREKYKEFLRIDFPIIPYPKNRDHFQKIAALGKDLREFHLLESPELKHLITRYEIDGSHQVDRIKYKDGKVYINETQYFDNVPKQAWEFYIGGYLPAQKWLKDRTNRTLSNSDVEHYQKVIVSIIKTQEIMVKVDQILST